MTSYTFTGETGSEKVEHVARRHPGLVMLGRLGWVAKGLVYGVFGVLAVQIALDASGREQGNAAEQEASQTGAVAEIADTSFGEVVLYVVAAGLLLYALWRVISVLLPAESSAKAWLTRVGYLVSAAVYTLLAWTALSFARHGGSSSAAEGEDAKVERFTRDLMEKSGGRWLVGAVGVLVIAIGLFFAIKGLQAKFRDELEPRDVGPIRHESIVTLGRVGWVGRAIVVSLVGWLLVRAAVRFRPDEAKGFDGALREVTDSGLGVALVWFAAIALVVYGLFCVISAPRQRLKGAD
jgi:hypothetical protein